HAPQRSAQHRDKTVWSDRLAIVGSRVSSTLQRHQSRIRKEPVMEKGTTFVGLDVHKEAIVNDEVKPYRFDEVKTYHPGEEGVVARAEEQVQVLRPIGMAGDAPGCPQIDAMKPGRSEGRPDLPH